MADVYSDIDFSFGLNSNGDIKLVTNADAISQSIKTVLFTRLGIRPGPGNRNFGTDTLSFLFAPVNGNSGNYLGETILTSLRVFEPRINVVGVNIQIINDTEYDINIEYEINIPEETGTRTFRLVLESL
jgi:phage baseplate assembly protein W